MLSFSFDYFLTVLPQLAEAVPYTFYFIIVSSAVSLLAGVVTACIRIARLPVLSPLTDVWMSFVRSMPFLLLLFLCYFVLPLCAEAIGLDSDSISKECYVYAAMFVHYGPIIAEVIRPAYQSVDKGQHEAAVAFGLSPYRRVTRIILPQALPVMLPGLVNQVIEIVKDTSLMYMIGLMDLMGRANLLIHVHQGRGKLECYVGVALLYWLLISVLEALLAYLNHKNARFLRRRPV